MNTVNMDEINRQIDVWVEATKELTGKECRERETWNYDVTPDTIKHFCYGTDDDNPLYLDPAYGAKSKYGKQIAPPGYLISVMYPILHGKGLKAPLASLIGGVKVTWERPIYVGDILHAVCKQKEFIEKKNKDGRRLNFVISEISYLDAQDKLVGTANGTMIMATQVGNQVMFERPINKLSDEALKQLEATWRGEKRTGAKKISLKDVQVGDKIPSMVRGPLTIGDMVAWNAAIGPSYKAGRWGFLEVIDKPHSQAVNPAINFPVKYSMQHEDSNLAAGRGMPGPFDNGVMRFAWTAPLITNWMGDDAFLKMLDVQVRAPGIYGDVTTFEGAISAKDEAAKTVTIDITGANQTGQVATKGTAIVQLP
jgi:acyl dehydratase